MTYFLIGAVWFAIGLIGGLTVCAGIRIADVAETPADDDSTWLDALPAEIVTDDEIARRFAANGGRLARGWFL